MYNSLLVCYKKNIGKLNAIITQPTFEYFSHRTLVHFILSYIQTYLPYKLIVRNYVLCYFFFKLICMDYSLKRLLTNI